MCLFSGLCLPTKPNFGPLEWYLKKFKSNLVAEVVGEASYGKSSFMLIHDGVSMSPIKQLDALLRSSLTLGLCSSLHWDANKSKKKFARLSCQ